MIHAENGKPYNKYIIVIINNIAKLNVNSHAKHLAKFLCVCVCVCVCVYVCVCRSIQWGNFEIKAHITMTDEQLGCSILSYLMDEMLCRE